MEAEGSAMHGAIAEESCQTAKEKISPAVEMTACVIPNLYQIR